MGIEIEVSEMKQIEEGLHQGTITKVDQRTTPFNYVDVYVKLEDDTTIKAGYPANISKGSGLGKMVARFGAVIAVGTKIDVEGLLMGKRVSFVTVNVENERGTFARIQRESLKPLGV